MPGRKKEPDTSVHFFAGNIETRRRKDGLTRVEIHLYNCEMRPIGFNCHEVVWYLTDDERREIAKTFDITS